MTLHITKGLIEALVQLSINRNSDIADIIKMPYMQDYIIRIELGRQMGHTSWVRDKLKTDPNAYLLYESDLALKSNDMSPVNRQCINITRNNIDKFRGMVKPSMLIVDRGILLSCRSNETKIFEFLDEFYKVIVRGYIPIVIVGN